MFDVITITQVWDEAALECGESDAPFVETLHPCNYVTDVMRVIERFDSPQASASLVRRGEPFYLTANARDYFADGDFVSVTIAVANPTSRRLAWFYDAANRLELV